MKYDPSRKKSDENVGMLWHHLYCYRAGESNLYLQKSKQGFLACLWGGGQYGCWAASWWCLGWWTWSVLWQWFCQYSPNHTMNVYISLMYIYLFLYICVCAMYMCVEVEMHLRLALMSFSITLRLIYSGRVSHRAWSSPLKLAWLASLLWRFPIPASLAFGIRGGY